MRSSGVRGLPDLLRGLVGRLARGPRKPAGESATAPVSDEGRERRQRIHGPFLSRRGGFAG